MKDYKKLRTEQQNPLSENIDSMTSLEIVTLINREDHTVADAVEKALPQIAEAVELLAEVLRNGGRIFYCGAGTSGRIGMLDASEILPTYGLDGRIIALLAGGTNAFTRAKEDSEDDRTSFYRDLSDTYGYCKEDILVAVSASGSAECVVGAIAFAKQKQSKTICVTCNGSSDLIPLCDLAIVADVGPEVILGSTRMKAGSAQKMILNMLSTGAMIRYGRVRGNRMAYMKPTNQKLVARAIRMITDLTGCTDSEAEAELKSADYVAADAIDRIRKRTNKQ